MTTFAYISRVPKSCTHPMDLQSVFLMESPNAFPDRETQSITHGTMEWRNLLAWKGTELDLTGKLDDWPDLYIVTRCDGCDAEKLRRWNDSFWERSPFERKKRFATWLAAQDFAAHTLTLKEHEIVLRGVSIFHLTPYDFKQLDEEPYNYSDNRELRTITFDDVGEREWHYALRQVRNAENNLYTLLKKNGKEYSDDNKVPPISLAIFNNMD